MTQLQKYTWLIDTIRRAGQISYKELSDRWERNKELSDCKPLHRATFNRWRDAIFSQFGIIISCRHDGSYLYYIENPEDIDDDELKKWMLDTFAVGNIISGNMSLKDRILVNPVPSGYDHLTPILEAMKRNLVINISYKPFYRSQPNTISVEPYCVKFFEKRWYLLARSISHDDLRIYGLDRIVNVTLTGETFSLPQGFSAAGLFSAYYGIVIDNDVKPVRIVIRANKSHKSYMKSLPMHHSQRLLAENDKYADFDLYLAPTYDFVMKLLQMGDMIEVLSPASVRSEMKDWISKMYKLYKTDKGRSVDK